MHALREILSQAQAAGAAIGHFNVADLVLLKAVFASARELKVPVLVGASEGERDFIGTGRLAAVVRSLREEFDFPIFLNADHTHSLAKAVEAVKAGFDARSSEGLIQLSSRCRPFLVGSIRSVIFGRRSSGLGSILPHVSIGWRRG
jgi:hypothetical protein